MDEEVLRRCCVCKLYEKPYQPYKMYKDNGANNIMFSDTYLSKECCKKDKDNYFILKTLPSYSKLTEQGVCVKERENER